MDENSLVRLLKAENRLMNKEVNKDMLRNI